MPRRRAPGPRQWTVTATLVEWDRLEITTRPASRNDFPLTNWRLLHDRFHLRIRFSFRITMDNSMREMRDFAQFAFPGRPIVVVEDSTPSAQWYGLLAQRRRSLEPSQ
ncbi:hypothetical protein H9L39_04250 [Fusarium oxysporum f. sp. albedinis]|nr:hypothetical protein H9L39_04250 [Fusarium oxysporum f. sp. albedinis]